MPELRLEKRNHPIKVRTLTVKHIKNVSPYMIRVTLGGEQAEGFYTPGFDDHIKLFFPAENGQEFALPVVGETGIQYDPALPKPLMRDYTPRYFDAVKNELDVDFVLHEGGVAAQWALQATVGDELVIAGPRGSILVPKAYDWYVLIGDETALPAIARRLEELDAHHQVFVYIQLQHAQAKQNLASQAQVHTQWITTENNVIEQLHEATLKALGAFVPPKGNGFVWAGVESALVEPLRAFSEHHGIAHGSTKISSYWKAE